MHPLIESIKKTDTPQGTAALWWLGQMGLIVKMAETVVCIDYFATPYAGRQTAPVVPTEEMEGIDAYLGTHDHLDHIDHDAWKVWAKTCPKAKFVCSKAHREAVLADGVMAENFVGLTDGESVKIGDITIHAIPAAHEFLDQDPQTGVYPHLQYVLEGNGIKIHHAGDTVRYEGMIGKLKAFGRMDAQLLPINGRDAEKYRRNCIGNMTYQEAVDFAGEAETKLVIPGHWDMFADNSEDPQAFADFLEVKYEGKVSCRIPAAGEKIFIG